MSAEQESAEQELRGASIGMVCPYSLTAPGGVQQQVLGLARAVRAKGVDVRVLAPCDGPPPETGVTPLGASLPTAANGSIAPIAPDLPAQIRLIKAIWNEQFDILHLHEPLAPGVGITTLLMQAAPMIGTFHAAGRSSAYRLLNRGCRSLRGRLTIACAVSEDAEALASQWLGGSYERVFNGIDIERFAGAASEPTRSPAIFFIGRHEERKGLRSLLEAASRLPDDVEIWIAGDGELTSSLRSRFVGKRYRWLGRISDEEKRARLASAAVLCAPSIGGESFGVVLLEAMAAGTPVVAGDIPGYATLTRNGSDALLVEPGNVDALADGLRQALDRTDEVRGRIERARARANDFSMSRLADLYLEKYRRLLGD